VRLVGEVHGVKEFRRHVGKIPNAIVCIVEQERIDGLNFNAANTCAAHGFKLLLQLRLGDRWTKPPPAHHDPRIVRRVLKTMVQSVDGILSHEDGR
jgi:hypothetical protein